MAKLIVFENVEQGQKVTISFNKQEYEVMVDFEGSNGNWYAFNNASELQEFIDELQKLQVQFKKSIE